jgi:hypothetical protein
MVLTNFPEDIILHIISYTYNLQNKKLLEDIKNFHDTKRQITQFYCDAWSFSSNDPYIAQINASEWLINDVFSYMNDHRASMYGFVKPFYNIFRRHPFLKKTKAIDKYFNALEKKSAIIQFNIVWGLLLPEERNIFCE